MVTCWEQYRVDVSFNLMAKQLTPPNLADLSRAFAIREPFAAAALFVWSVESLTEAEERVRNAGSAKVRSILQ